MGAATLEHTVLNTNIHVHVHANIYDNIHVHANIHLHANIHVHANPEDNTTMRSPLECWTRLGMVM